MGHSPVWLTALAVAVLIGALVAIFLAAGNQDQQQQAHRDAESADHEDHLSDHDTWLTDHEHRLRAIEDFLETRYARTEQGSREPRRRP